MFQDLYPQFTLELKQLNSAQVNSLEAIKIFSEMCFDSDHDPQFTWSILHSGLRNEFKDLHQHCKENDLPNLRKWLGRRYNMLYNVPKDFEIYRGRVYEPVF